MSLHSCRSFPPSLLSQVTHNLMMCALSIIRYCLACWKGCIIAMDTGCLAMISLSSHWSSLDYPFCDANKTISSRWNYSWPETMGNTVVTLPCTFGPDGSTASRECTPNGIWQAPKLRYCTTFLTYQLSKVVCIDGVKERVKG